MTLNISLHEYDMVLILLYCVHFNICYSLKLFGMCLWGKPVNSSYLAMKIDVCKIFNYNYYNFHMY